MLGKISCRGSPSVFCAVVLVVVVVVFVVLVIVGRFLVVRVCVIRLGPQLVCRAADACTIRSAVSTEAAWSKHLPWHSGASGGTWTAPHACLW